MSSGVTVDEDCLAQYRHLQRKINGLKHKFIIYKVSDDRTKIVVEKTDDKETRTAADQTNNEEAFESFVAALPSDECRWATYDFEYDLGDAGKRSKIVFIAWSPDEATIRKKMVFASSTEALRRAVGVASVIQATDTSEVAYETILEKVKKT